MASEIAFRETVLDICHSLSAYDLEQIVYLHKIPEDGKITPLSALKRLERQGHFSALQPDGLEALLRTIRRSDLCGVVQEYYGRFKTCLNCCGVQPCRTRHVSDLMKLCVAEAENTHKRISTLQKSMEKFSEGQRRTPQGDKFFKEMGEEFELLQSELRKYLISPLNDLQKCLCVVGSEEERTGKSIVK